MNAGTIGGYIYTCFSLVEHALSDFTQVLNQYTKNVINLIQRFFELAYYNVFLNICDNQSSVTILFIFKQIGEMSPLILKINTFPITGALLSISVYLY